MFISTGTPPLMIDGWRGKTLDELATIFDSWNAGIGLNLTYRIVLQDTDIKNWDGRVLEWRPGTGAPLAEGQRITFIVGNYAGDG